MVVPKLIKIVVPKLIKIVVPELIKIKDKYDKYDKHTIKLKNNVKIIDKITNVMSSDISFSGWHNKKLSNKMNKPVDDTFKQNKSTLINLGNTKFESKYCEHYDYKIKTNLFCFNKFEPLIDKDDAKNLKAISTKIKKIKLIEKPSDKDISKLKGLKTRQKNTEYKANNIMKTTKIEIFPTIKQDKIYKKWFESAEKCYNKCVDMYEKDNMYFNDGYKVKKLDIFYQLYNGDDKDCPYDILTDEVRKFCSNLKSCESNLKEKNIKNFKMNHLNRYRNKDCIFIPKTAVKRGSTYSSHIGKMKGLEKLPDILCDCRLLYHRKKKKYWLCIPNVVKRKNIKNRESVVGIDAGEAVFVTYHGENSFGMIGKNIREPILNEINKIERRQRILGKNKNKKEKTIKNKKKIKDEIQSRYDRIHNVVKELHNKTALFLCKKYERIMLPEFNTQGMMRKKKY